MWTNIYIKQADILASALRKVVTYFQNEIVQSSYHTAAFYSLKNKRQITSFHFRFRPPKTKECKYVLSLWHEQFTMWMKHVDIWDPLLPYSIALVQNARKPVRQRGDDKKKHSYTRKRDMAQQQWADKLLRRN